MTSAAERLSQLAGALDAGGMVANSSLTGGAPGGSHTHIWNEVPTGTIDGVATVLTLAGTPIGGSLLLFRNGLLLRAGAGNDYTLLAAVITFLPSNLCQPGDVVLASYTT